MKCASGRRRHLDRARPARGRARGARARPARSLGGSRADLAVVFASGAHLVAPEAMLDGSPRRAGAPQRWSAAAPAACSAAGRELEVGNRAWRCGRRTSTARGEREPFHATVSATTTVPLEGLPELGETSGAILLSDPYSFPADPVLAELSADRPGVPVLGGLASGRTPRGRRAPCSSTTRSTSRAPSASGCDGVEMLPCVSQGAAPLGREVTITAAEGNVIHELAGRPGARDGRADHRRARRRESGRWSPPGC